jgi:SAM-dependent methyltransferase
MMKNEIATHYNSVGDDYYSGWEKMTSGMKYIRKFEKDFVIDSLKDFKKSYSTKVDLKALDVGCGPGRIADFCMEVGGFSYHGLDISAEMVSAIKKRHGKNKAFVKADVCDTTGGLPYDSSYFDVATSIRVLKYNPEWKRIVSEVSRVLRPKGHFIFSIPNKYSLNVFSKGAIPIYKSSISEITKVLEDNGFTDINIRESSKIPDPLYVLLPEKVVKVLMLNVEKALAAVLGNKFSRLLYISCVKK